MRTKQKTQIEINNYRYEDGLIYGAISFLGGYTTRNYLINGDSLFTANYAFYNVLFNYLRLSGKMDNCYFNVFQGASVISFCSKPDSYVENVNYAMELLFGHEFDSELFEFAKLQTMDGFVQAFKDGEFRGRFKGYEFAELNKGFTLNSLVKDIETITYEEFVDNAEHLVIPSNIKVFITGDTSKIDFSKIEFEKYEDQYVDSIMVAAHEFNPFYRQDAHIMNVAREEYNIIIETFDFINKDVTNFTKQYIVEMFSELIGGDEVDIWVDDFDASIIFTSPELKAFKNSLLFTDEKQYELNKKQLLCEYLLMMEHNPRHFAIKSARLMTIGISVDQYIEFIDSCTYDMFNEMCAKSDCKKTEAQVVLRKAV